MTLSEQFLVLAEDYVEPQPNIIIEGDFRPRITLPGDGRLLDDFAADLVKEIREKPIFNHGGLPMVIDVETNKLRTLGQSSFRSWIEHPNCGNLVCMGRVGRGRESFMQDQTLNEEGAKGLLASHRFLQGLRKISRVNTVRLPILRANGALELLPEGYDEESAVFTVVTATYAEDISLESAKANLAHLLADTAFSKDDRERSFSATLSMMLAPFCDSLFGRFACRPSFIVQANQEGAGKTTLIRIALAPIFGPVKLTPPPAKGSEDKLVELLNSVAQSGAPYLAFDNWIGKIESGALAAFITANALSARVLGTSYMFDAEKHCLVFLSANQANVVGEMRRRSIFIDLFVEEAKAEDRKIGKPIDEGDILSARADILGSLWALVRTWRDAGSIPGSKANASFPQWGAVIGGIIEAAGYPSPLLPPPQALDQRLDSFTKVVTAAVAGILGDQVFYPPSDLIEIARNAGAFPWFLDADPPDTDKPDGRKDAKSERRSFGFHCDHFRARTFNIDGMMVNFDAVGEGHAKRYQFTKIGSIS